MSLTEAERNRLARIEIDLDLLWNCYFDWERAVRKFGKELVLQLLVHEEDEKSHRYAYWLRGELKKLEEDTMGQKKYIFNLGEDVVRHSKEIEKIIGSRKTKDDKYIIK